MRRITNPLEELINPTATAAVDDYGAGAMAIHNFAHSNPELIKRGKAYLQEQSGLAYDAEIHVSKATYVDQYLIPVLTDLQARIEKGEWDYVGKDAAGKEKRNNEKEEVTGYLERLKIEYPSSPNDAGVEEFVMFHKILEKEKHIEKEGSPFIILFENIIENLVANGEAASCKPGIQERIIRDAAVKETAEKETVRAIETGFNSMQKYHLEYLNRFCKYDGKPTKLLRDITAYHIANSLKEQDKPEEGTIEASCQETKGNVKISLEKYTQAMGLPLVCSWFDTETASRLDTEVIEVISGEGGFFADRQAEIDSDSYDAANDADLARQELIATLKAECVSYCLQRDLPKGYSWHAIIGNNELIKEVTNNHMYVAEIAASANERLRTALQSLEIEATDITEEMVTHNIVLHSSAEGFDQVGLREINHDVCIRDFNDAIKDWNTSPFILSCYDRQDISEEAYKNINVIIDEEPENVGILSDDLLRVIVALSLSKKDNVIDTLAKSLNQPLTHFMFKYAGQAELEVFLKKVPLSEDMLLSRDNKNKTVLMYAAEGGNTEAINVISEYCTKAVLTAQDNNGETALMLGAREGHTEAVKAILKSPKCTEWVLSDQSSYGCTALMFAAAFGNTETAKAILASPHCTDKVLSAKESNGGTSLLFAARDGHTEIVKAILESRHCTLYVLSAKNSSGGTSLIFAAREGHTKIVKAILASPHCTDKVLSDQSSYGETALILAASKGHTETVKGILASPHCTTKMLLARDRIGEWETAFMRAARGGHTEVVNAILASPHCTDEVLLGNGYDDTALMVAAQRQRGTGVVNAILASPKYTADVLLAQNKNGDTALMLAASEGNTETVKAILTNPKYSAKVLLAQNKNGDTALILGIREGHSETVKAILDSRGFGPTWRERLQLLIRGYLRPALTPSMPKLFNREKGVSSQELPVNRNISAPEPTADGNNPPERPNQDHRQ